MTGRLGEVYPKIGEDKDKVTRVEMGKINSVALIPPTVTVTGVTAVIADMGFIKVRINGQNRNILMCLD